tara:strand:- start:408 stop:1205 length:798 start_codon:yes stop_codon:yes gene_type:complete
MIEGHSGCEISVRGAILEKSSAGRYPIDRLQKQSEKQIAFSKGCFEGVLVPEIYSTKKINNNFIIEMEYLSCLNAIQYLNRAGKEQLDVLANTLFKFIKNNVTNSETIRVDGSVVSKKFESVKKTSRINNLDHIFEKYYTDELELPVGLCHGDLTLSNILFSQDSNEIVLIDFLDSFIESPIVDIAKIRQDTRHKWSTFIHTERHDKNKIEISLEYLDEKLNSMLSTFSFYKYYKLFQFMNLIRILPYSRNQKTTDYLMREICSI